MIIRDATPSDIGYMLKATTVPALLNWLGVKSSYPRSRESDDNAYSESLFRSGKGRGRVESFWPHPGGTGGRDDKCA